MDTPTISRSGRLVKKSAKVKEMEDFDITDLEQQGSKARKKFKSGDDYEEFDDKRIQPIKIPKISLNISPSASTSYSAQSKKKTPDSIHSLSKIPPFPSPVKSKLDPNRPLFQESSPETSKEYGSSSLSSESSSSSSSSSSSDDSETDYNMKNRGPKALVKTSISPNLQKMPMPQEKVIVESYKQQFNSPLTFVDQNTDLTMYASEEETSESNLVIAEESIDSSTKQKDRKGSAAKRKPAKKPIPKLVGASKSKVQRKRPPATKDGKAGARRKADQANKDKKITAYMLWCSENKKRIAAQNPVLFSSISKKMGEIWQALPEKEKMAWRRKAKKVSQKGAELISTGRPSQPPKAIIPTVNEGLLQLSPDMKANIGTTPIDVAAYLKLLGESLSIIGQRLTEHEGQIAVSGIFSVLLDSTLCALGPLLCLTSETDELNGCPQPTLSKILDNIAYFMPGL